MRNRFTGLALAVSVLGGVTALAQNAQPQPAPPVQPQIQPRLPVATQPQPGQPAQPRTQPGQPQPGQQLTRQGGQMSSADQQVAALIFACCHNEVEISKFAQPKLQSAEARAFAEKMVTDHTPDCESYQRWAGKQAAGVALTTGDEAPAAERRVAHPGGGADWTAIHEQVAKQCLASTKQELGRHQGNDFDKCFMGHQLAGHMKMQDELKVLRNHVSPELQQQIDKSLQVVQGHLQEARQVMEQLKDSPPERVSRKPANE